MNPLLEQAPARAQDDVLAVAAASTRELAEWMKAAVRHGPAYAERYATWLLTGRRLTNAPRAPLELPLEIAAVIRESVREQAMVQRRLLA